MINYWRKWVSNKHKCVTLNWRTLTASQAGICISKHRVRVLTGVAFLVSLLALHPAQSSQINKKELAAEKALGNLQSSAFLQASVVVRCPRFENHLKQLVNITLAPAAGLSGEFNVHIINEPLIEALSLPPNHIFIYRGLLDELKNRDQLAAILAHELAHLKHHDTLTTLRKNIAQKRAVETALIVTNLGLSYVLSHAVSGLLAKAMQPEIDFKAVKGVRGSMGKIRHIKNYNEVYLSKAGDLILPDMASRLGQQFSSPIVAGIMVSILGRSKNSEAEKRADRAATGYLSTAGFNPNALNDVLEMYRKRTKTLKR